MARKKAGDEPSKEGPSAAEAGWAKLTWDDLVSWAGSGAVSRGRTYQGGGRVKDLAISPDGKLLATVLGTERYATLVEIDPSPTPSVESTCSCPVGSACKHAVAVVAEYLRAIADGRKIPVAPDDDPRWMALEDEGAETHHAPDDDESWDDEDEEEVPIRPARSPRRTGPGKGGPVNWDRKIEEHLRAQSQGELADLVWSLARRFPEIHREFRERLALQEGDVARLLAETRREIRSITAEPDWGDDWGHGGSSPEYSRILHRFERLLDRGLADEVVSLGRDFLARGMEQIGQSDDESGELASEFAACMAVVFRAVMGSSLSGTERLMFVIDAELADDYDALGEGSAAILDETTDPESWSTVADTLIGRLAASRSSKEDGASKFARDYQRDRIADRAADALLAAGRDGEVRGLFEAEAGRTKSYDRLVAHLIASGQVDDAERWAHEGIVATSREWPGIAENLAAKLRELAMARKRWDIVAAHDARRFFDRPSPAGFLELMKSAKKAKVEATVRAAALHFLETGAPPYWLIAGPPEPQRVVSPARSRGKSRAVPPAETKKPVPARIEVDPDWPLPFPEDLLPLLSRARRDEAPPKPHFDVLLDMAIAAKRPEDVLRWFDAMRAERKTAGAYYTTPSFYADRVAVAVAATHPERAIDVYRAALDGQLPHASPSAYESAAGYLRKLRPLYQAVDREGEWIALLASIREKYRNRPRFMEVLDPLDGRTILESGRPKRK